MNKNTDAYGRTINEYTKRADSALRSAHVRGKHSDTARHGCPERECIDRWNEYMDIRSKRANLEPGYRSLVA